MSPRRPKRPCPGAGRYKGRCPALIDHGVQVCPRCAPLVQEEKRAAGREYDRDRLSPSKRGYNRNHYKLRKMIFNEEGGLCRKCREEGRLQAAAELHHKDGNAWNLERENLIPLCKSHHSSITNKTQGGGWQGTGAGSER